MDQVFKVSKIKILFLFWEYFFSNGCVIVFNIFNNTYFHSNGRLTWQILILGHLYLYLKYFVHGHPLEPWEVKCESTAQPVLCLLFRDGGISALLQLLLCYNQIMIIVSLCLDEGRSLISKLFNSNLMQFLGRISMSLYLIHDALIFYLQFLFNGKIFGITI